MRTKRVLGVGTCFLAIALGMGGAAGRLVAYMVITRSTAFSLVSMHEFLRNKSSVDVRACGEAHNLGSIHALTNEAESDHRRCDANALRRLDGGAAPHQPQWVLYVVD
jgi:hypothetical protein